MRIFNSSPLQSARLVNRMRPEDYLVSLVTTLRLTLAVDGICALLPEKQQPGLRKSESYDDGMGNSPCFGGDFAPFKPRTDVTLVGQAQAPGGQKLTHLPVTIGVNAWRKTLDVIGDRDLIRQETVVFSPPQPFSSMGLRLERAFGGLKSPHNPWGKGYGILGSAPGSTLPACNIHPAGQRHFDWVAKIPACTFGPLPANRPPRSKLRGTHDDAWLYQRKPLPPVDFDWGYYNVAPPDQQFAPYLKGGETLYFEHVNPDFPHFSSKLPGLRLRVLIRRRMPDEPGFQIEELRPQLDSVHVDTDTMTVDLAWRAVTRSLDKDAADITDGYVATEEMVQPARPLAEHVEAFQAKINPPRLALPRPTSESGPSADEAAEDEDEQMETLKAAIAKMPFKADFKQAIADAKTSVEIKTLIDAEAKLALKSMERVAKAPVQ